MLLCIVLWTRTTRSHRVKEAHIQFWVVCGNRNADSINTSLSKGLSDRFESRVVGKTVGSDSHLG